MTTSFDTQISAVVLLKSQNIQATRISHVLVGLSHGPSKAGSVSRVAPTSSFPQCYSGVTGIYEALPTSTGSLKQKPRQHVFLLFGYELISLCVAQTVMPVSG